MPYRLKSNESVHRGFQRIVSEQIERALGELHDESLKNEETVHQVRKRCKKVRGALRLVRPALGDTYGRENKWYRDASRTLSDIRDAEVMIETYGSVLHRCGDKLDGRAMQPILKALKQHKQSVTAGSAHTQQLLEAFEDELTAGLRRVASWQLSKQHFAALSGGLHKTYSRAYKAMENAYTERSSESFHEWRKRVKYHWYHMRILNEIWPKAMRVRRKAIDRLGTLLGDHHDLSVLRDLVLNDPNAYAKDSTVIKFAGCIDLQLRQIEEKSLPLGKRLFAEKPKQFVRRFEAYWEAWR